MKEEKKSNQPKFNIYWIYGAIIFVLLGLSLFGGNDWQSTSKTNISNFEKFLNAGDVSEVIVIRNKSSVRVTLTKEALNKPEHKTLLTKNILGQENIKGPHYQFEVGSLELFEEKLEKARDNGAIFRLEFITIENRWLDTLIGFLPIIIIIGVWIFLMRRMSGGGAGGPGPGQQPDPGGPDRRQPGGSRGSRLRLYQSPVSGCGQQWLGATRRGQRQLFALSD